MIDIVTKNIQQIGTTTEEDRIYISDRVYKRILGEEMREKNTYVLMGHTESSGGRYATFIEDAIQLWDVEYEESVPKWNNRLWSQVFQEVKEKHENSIIIGWALDRKGYKPEAGPEIERIHREHFGGAHQLLFLSDSMDRESFFYVNRGNRLCQKKGFFVYYRLEEQPDNSERVKINIPSQVPERPLGGEVTRTERGRYREYMSAQTVQEREPSTGGSGLVVIFVAMLVIAVGVGLYTRRDMLMGKSEKAMEVISTEHKVQDTQEELVPVEKVSGGSLAN